MSRSQRIALAVLAGNGLGIGVLLWLATATDRLPDGGVLIALGAVLVSGTSILWTRLYRHSAESESCTPESASRSGR